MSINYATKYSPLVDERFKLGAVTAGAVNDNYDWAGVHTVRIYSIPTAPMQDYSREGAQRYGLPEELPNSVYELPISRDRSFTFTIDRGNYEDTMMTSSAGTALRRQLDEVVIPEIDKYRIAAMACGAKNYGTGTLNATNAYETLLDADISLTEGNVPPFGRIAFVSPKFYKLIKLDNAFVRQGDSSQDMLVTGAVGMVDNIRIVRVPAGYLPSGTEFLLTHPEAVVAPQKLAEYKIHDNPPGINGWLVEGRVCYDAFVLKSKADAIYLHQSAIGSLGIRTAAAGTGKSQVIVEGGQGVTLLYKINTTAPALLADVSSWSELPNDGIVSASNGQKVTVAVAIKGKALLSGTADIVVG